MISAEYYSLVYIIIVIVIAIPVVVRYAGSVTNNYNNRDNEPIINSLLFTILIIVFVSVRPNSVVFSDGTGYWNAILDHRWESRELEDISYQFATKWLISFMSSNNFSPRIGFFVYSIIVYGVAFIALRKLFPCDTLIAMILFCSSISTFSGATNGIKNGMACSLFICALAYRDNWVKCLLLLVLSFGFHHSMQLSIAAFICCVFYKNTKVYFYVWLLCVAIAAMHITYFQTMFAGYTDEQGAGYLITDEYSVVKGFRLDFIMYSFAPIALAIWAFSKKVVLSGDYLFVLNIYLVMNSIWLLCMYASYTNRIATLSWSLFPLLILQPLINNRLSFNQFKILSWFVVGQLSFNFIQSIISTSQYM